MFYFFVEYSERCGVFGNDYDSAGVSVNPVTERRCKGGLQLRLVFTLFVQVMLYPVNQRIYGVIVILMHHQAARLIDKEDVFILVNN